MKRFKLSKSQAIASMKKHKMDMSFLKNESVKESIQLPHGMKLGKVFTGHGKSFVKEEVTKSKGVQKIFDIQKTGYAKLGGKMLDSLSAGLFTQLYDKASDDIKEKMNKMNEKRLYVVIGKMWHKFGNQVRIS